jgi:glycosyltransferase involved in cell wall biosynthesis
LDSVIVSSLQYDAYATMAALSGTNIPVLLRAERGGPSGDCQWQREARFGSRIKRRCQQAGRIIAPTDNIATELRAAGYDPARVAVVPNGVPLAEPRTDQRRRAAREILGDANPDLRVPESTPVALYVGRLHASQGLHDLVRAWRRIVTIWPDARLWLIGDGSEREDLYDRIRDHELKYHVAMPGAFDDVSELLQAADVFVQPATEAGTSQSLLEAMASGLPIVATNIPGHQRLITNRDHGLLVPVKDPLTLAEAIAEVVTLRDEASLRAEQARQRAISEFAAASMARRHLELIESLRAFHP